MAENKVIQPYEHDCKRCKWVGWMSVGEKLGNVYLCGQTVVVRWSSEPSDYWAATAGDSRKGSIRIL